MKKFSSAHAVLGLAAVLIPGLVQAQTTEAKPAAEANAGAAAGASAPGAAPAAPAAAEAPAATTTSATTTSVETTDSTTAAPITSQTEAAAAGATAEVPPAANPDTGPDDIPYLDRYKPEANLWELGLFGGVLFPSNSHQLFDPGLPASVQQPFKTAGELGVRFAYYPLSFLGAEVEAAAMPGETDDGRGAGLWAARGHLIGQLPIKSIVPFVLVGAGALGASSEAMGSDTDSAIHFGLGAKAAIGQNLLVRLDVRDTLTRQVGASSSTATHSPEILIGLSFVPTRRSPDRDGDGVLDYKDHCPGQAGDYDGCPAPDTDGDGVADDVDECVEEAGIEPTGCPDQDGDGVLDRDDLCPTEASSGPGGCPEKVCPVADLDGDGLTNEVDQCPNEAAKTPTGCVIHDADGDGIPDEKDKCPEAAENKNGFEDEDGCPDVIPERVKKFTGVIKGIEFDFGSAKIKKTSEPLLKEAALVLKEFPAVRVRITGHTDDQGERAVNLKISEERAQSVRDFLVQEGAAADQVETRGAGPDLPIADNKTPAGRQKNRRIEFEVISR